MTNWYWIRHGPTHLKSLVGWSDVDVDLSNINMLQRLDNFLPNNSIIVSSDLKRCIKTADEIQGLRERLPNNRNLREFNFGDWELKKSVKIAEEYPQLSKEYWTNPGDTAPPNGESWNEAAKRVNAEVDIINQKYKGRNIIAVGHFGVILTQLQRAAKIQSQSAISFQIDNLSVTHLEHLGDKHWRILGVNFTI